MLFRSEKTLEADFQSYKFDLIPSSNGIFGVERKFLGIFPLNKIGSLELAKIQVRHTEFAGRKLLKKKIAKFFVLRLKDLRRGY